MINALKKTIAVCLIGLGLGIVIIAVGIMWITC